MSWQDQGRQEHGWFGSAAAAKDGPAGGASADGGIFGAAGLNQRVQATIHGATGALPAALRGHAATRPDAQALERLTGLMIAWGRGAPMGRGSFAAHFLADRGMIQRRSSCMKRRGSPIWHNAIPSFAMPRAILPQRNKSLDWIGGRPSSRMRHNVPVTRQQPRSLRKIPRRQFIIE